MELIQGLIREWYLILSQVSVALSVPVKELKTSQHRISQLSGLIFILVGVNDTLTYWFI